MNGYEDDKIKASPAARRLARELGIDLSKLEGKGIDGRIQLSDVEEYNNQPLDSKKEEPAQDIVSHVETAMYERNVRNNPAKQNDSLIAGCDVYADTIRKALMQEDEEEKQEEEKQEEEKQEAHSMGYSIHMYDKDEQNSEGERLLEAESEDEKEASANNSGEMKIEKFTYDPAIFGIYEDKKTNENTSDDELKENVIEKMEKKQDSDDIQKSTLNQDLSDTQNETNNEAENDNKPYSLYFGDEPVKESPAEQDEENKVSREEKPNEPDKTKDETEKEEECSCCAHHHEEDDECCDEDDIDDEACEPLRIDFDVDENALRDEFEKQGVLFEQGITDAVVKALALAIYDADETYDGIMNYVKITREDIDVRTVTNALDASLGEIVYSEPYDYEDVFINVWDMTSFGFTSMARPDKDSINVFFMRKNGRIYISTVSDEYIVDIMTCCTMMDDFRMNLEKPSSALSRKEYTVIEGYDDEDEEDDNTSED